MVSVFDFTDHRQYLREYYAFGKKHSRLSHRLLARRCGFGSPSFLKLVMEGRANLTQESVGMVSKGLGHDRREATYFAGVVDFSQARSVSGKLSALERLKALCDGLDVKLVDSDSYDYYADTHNALLRELAGAVRFNGDHALLRSLMRAPLPLPRIKRILRSLVAMGFLKEEGGGNYAVVHRHISTGSEVSSLVVRRFHRAMAEAGAEAVLAVPPEERDVSGVTMTVSEECFRRIRAEIECFRSTVIAMADRDGGADRVYRLNVQLFPLSERIPAHVQKRQAERSAQ